MHSILPQQNLLFIDAHKRPILNEIENEMSMKLTTRPHLDQCIEP